MKIPARGVLTPDALFTAVLVKEPVIGIERTKEPITLQRPKANISCVASSGLPLAAKENQKSALLDNNIQKAFAIETASRIATNGMNASDGP